MVFLDTLVSVVLAVILVLLAGQVSAAGPAFQATAASRVFQAGRVLAASQDSLVRMATLVAPLLTLPMIPQ